MNQVRLILDQPAEGAWNMAVDQALLLSAGDSRQATLRFYRWSRPTLSLGYFQRAEDRQTHPASLGCDWVRRKTGGGAILHHHELTYSLAVPLQNRWAADHAALYDQIHQVIIDYLATLGLDAQLQAEADSSTHGQPVEGVVGLTGQTAGWQEGRPQIDSQSFLCFQRRTSGDIVLDGWKVTGSAQRRSKAALLQHGSLLLSRSEFAPELPGVGNWLAEPIDTLEIQQNVARRIGDCLQVDLKHGKLSVEETRIAADLEHLFLSRQWNHAR